MTIPAFAEKKIINPKDLVKKIEHIHSEGNTIATINGSFDLLHVGHLSILYEASLQADVLIVALNTDSSIRKLKGKSRPIVNLNNRLIMMAALSFVSFVTWFNESDPRMLLDKIKPNVHINGSEYGKNCIEADVVKKHGGHIHIVPLITGLSTSELINKIKKLCV